MNKKDHLLADIFVNPDGERFAHKAALQARRFRAVEQASLVAGLCITAVAVLFVHRLSHRERVVSTSSPSRTPVFEMISDQELIAQLKDQQVLYLKDQAHITRVVFIAAQKTGSKL